MIRRQSTSVSQFQIFTLRPDKTSLWLPNLLCEALFIDRGDHLSEDQFAHELIQDLLLRRRAAKKGDTVFE